MVVVPLTENPKTPKKCTLEYCNLEQRSNHTASVVITGGRLWSYRSWKTTKGQKITRSRKRQVASRKRSYQRSGHTTVTMAVIPAWNFQNSKRDDARSNASMRQSLSNMTPWCYQDTSQGINLDVHRNREVNFMHSIWFRKFWRSFLYILDPWKHDITIYKTNK